MRIFTSITSTTAWRIYLSILTQVYGSISLSSAPTARVNVHEPLSELMFGAYTKFACGRFPRARVWRNVWCRRRFDNSTAKETDNSRWCSVGRPAEKITNDSPAAISHQEIFLAILLAITPSLTPGSSDQLPRIRRPLFDRRASLT